MIRVRHITSEQLGKLVGDQLGSKLWIQGMMNEIRRYPNEIPCESNEIPSMILPFATGEQKVEWGFTAGMSCLSPGEDGAVIVRNADHFPSCAVLAILSLLYDADAAAGKKITLKLRYTDGPQLKPFLDLLHEAEQKLQQVTFEKDGTLPAEPRPSAAAPRKLMPIGSAVCVVQGLQQIDVGRFAAKVRCVDGSVRVKDDLTVTDSKWTVLQEHCPVTLISNANNRTVDCSDKLDEDAFFVCLAMWFPPNTPAFDGMCFVAENKAPLFTPAKMPPAVVIKPEKIGLFSWLRKN